MPSVVLHKLSFIGHSENPAKARSLLNQTPQRPATRRFYRFKVSGCAQRCSEARWWQEGEQHDIPQCVFLLLHELSEEAIERVRFQHTGQVCIYFFFPTPRANPGASGIPAPCAFFSRFKAYLRVASSLQTEAGSKVNPAKQPTPFKKKKQPKTKKKKKREGKKSPSFPKGKKTKKR